MSEVNSYSARSNLHRWGCPRDKNLLLLDSTSQSFRCPQCGSNFKTLRDYIDFTDNNDYYWGEIPKNNMEEILSWARARGYKSAIQDLLPSFGEGYQHSLLEESRADWTILAEIDSSSIVLDIGSGWGRLTFPLARLCAQVYSLEYIKERLEFQSIVRAQDNYNNVNLCRGSFLALPFQKATFDAVVLNGVLEWVGLARNDRENPSHMQRNVLSDCYNILKPGGRLYIGIENRFGYNLILGSRDHLGFRYTSLMPRFVANLYVNARSQGKAYRTTKSTGYCTYTYSLHGYVRLLRNSGFTDIKIYASWPNYNTIRSLIQIYPSIPQTIGNYFLETMLDQHTLTMKLIIFQKVSRILNRLNLLRYFYPCFSIIATK